MRVFARDVRMESSPTKRGQDGSSAQATGLNRGTFGSAVTPRVAPTTPQLAARSLLVVVGDSWLLEHGGRELKAALSRTEVWTPNTSHRT